MIYTATEEIHSLVLKPDLSTAFWANSKEILIFDVEKGAIGGSIPHKSTTIDHLAIDPNHEMLTYVSDNKEVKVLDKKSNQYFKINIE